MRVQKPLTLARRRQLCGQPVHRAGMPTPPHEEQGAEIYDLREERRVFVEARAAAEPRPRAGE